MKTFDSNLAILLVDDDAMVKSILHEYLLSMGFKNVFVAKKSNQALQVVQDSKVKIDLVISDWEMPEVSGLTLLKAVRNHPTRKHTPFLLVTSQRSMERFKITQAAQWAVDGYLMKPFRMDAFKKKIYEILKWSEQAA